MSILTNVFCCPAVHTKSVGQKTINLLKRSTNIKKVIYNLVVYLASLPLVFLFKITGPPRILRYGCTMNRLLLKAFGAAVGDHNVRVNSPVVLHNFWEEGDYRHLAIGDDCLFNGNNFLDLRAPLTLEQGVSLGPGVTIMTHNSYNTNAFLIETLKHTWGKKPVHIKKGACIKAHALIVHGITIGENAVVAGGAVVNRDVPPYCFVAGVPAKILKTFNPPPPAQLNPHTDKETIAWT